LPIDPIRKETPVDPPLPLRRVSKPAVTKSPHAGKQTKASSTSKNSFWEFIKPAITFLGALYGVVEPDNTQYLNFRDSLPVQVQKSDDSSILIQRAKLVKEKALEAIDFVSKNGLQNLKSNVGIPISSELSFLSGGYSPEQHYEHNQAAFWWAENILQGRTILDVEDLDNTNLNKNTTTWGTRRVQGKEVIHWNNQANRALSTELKGKLLINTARSILPTAIYARNEGLEGSATIGVLNSPLEELAGLSIDEQLELAERADIASMNGSVVHYVRKPTYFSNKVIRADEIFRFLQGVTIDGKNFVDEYFKSPTEEHEFTAAEPKGVTSYLIDTHRIIGEVYYPHYLKIIQLKEQCVDNRQKGKTEKQGWIDFAQALKTNVDEGCKQIPTLLEEIRGQCSNLSELETKGPGFVEDADETRRNIEKLEKKYYSYIRLIGSSMDDKTSSNNGRFNAENYYELLLKNPQAFFEKVTEGRVTALNYHFFNSRGIPLTRKKTGYSEGAIPVYTLDATEQAIRNLNKYGSDPLVRQKVAELNTLPTTNGLHSHIEGFRKEGINILTDNVDDDSKKSGKYAPMKYINHRLTRHLMHIYTKGQLQSIEDCRNTNEGKRLFKCEEEELTFSNEFLALGKKVYDERGLEGYVNWLDSQFSQKAGEDQYSRSVGLESELVNFIKATFPLEKLKASKSGIEGKDKFTITDTANVTYSFTKDDFLPNELFSINNNKSTYIGKYSFDSIFCLVDKRDIQYVGKAEVEKPENKSKKYIFIPYTTVLSSVQGTMHEVKPLGFYAELGANPDQQYYPEYQPAKEKFSAVPSFSECKKKDYAVISAGDSKSDVGTHVAALERGGIANVVFGLIRDSHIYNETIDQRIKYVDDLLKAKNNNSVAIDLPVLYKSSNGQVYGLEKVTEGGQTKYRKVRDVKPDGTIKPDGSINMVSIYVDDKTYTKDQIIAEITKSYNGRIIHNVCPEAKVRRQAEIISFLSGVDIEFNEEKYKQAVALYNRQKERPVILSPEQCKLLEAYKWAIIEKENESLVSQEAPRFRVWYEYHDSSGNVYYRRKADGVFVNKNNETEVFAGNVSKLRKVAIRRSDGGFVKCTGAKETPFTDIGFINKALCEEEILPGSSPIGGLFASKFLQNAIGKQNLKKFVTNLPTIFNKILEWSGGIMAAGGVVRLASSILGSAGEPLFKVGYWMSNSLRAVSAMAGALRGELNVYRSHNIFAGEMINVFAALKLPDGLKHAVLGLGNFVLFLGRGQQRVQQMQRINNHPEEVLKGGPNKDKYVDPRPYVRDVTDFSTRLVMDAKKTAKKHGVSVLLGEIVGNLASAALTPVQMLRDIVKEPKLIYQIVPRVAEKSGLSHYAVPSVGHLMTLVGTMSGLSAIVAATMGRAKDAGEELFNDVGKFAISFANAIPALGIIANGLEVMSNSAGLPKISRDLNGKDLRFNPKRAGLGQVIAGIGYGIVPWFGLQNKNVASLYDIINGIYFGMPGAKMSVAEEEKLNTISLARNILIEGQEYYKQRDLKTQPNESFQVKALKKAG